MQAEPNQAEQLASPVERSLLAYVPRHTWGHAEIALHSARADMGRTRRFSGAPNVANLRGRLVLLRGSLVTAPERGIALCSTCLAI